MNEAKPEPRRAIRVLIVDDSAFMRIAMRQMLQREEGIEVAGEARDGVEAVEMVARLDPDIVTLDVIMPRMDGLQALRKIMAEHPRPVIMVSTETQEGAVAAIRALDLGAVDCIAKTTAHSKLDMAWVESQIADKVRFWVESWTPPAPRAEPHVVAPREEVAPTEVPDLVAVVASTGGPRALTELLCAVKRLCAPMIVAQHMPQGFTRDLASHLAMRSGLDVVEGVPGTALTPGRVAILPGGENGIVAGDLAGGYVARRAEQRTGSVWPSADVLLESVVNRAISPVAVVLTGMGSDGAAGASAFAARGLPVLVQRPSTCVVDGMPRSAIAAGAASEVLSVAEIARRLNAWCGAKATEDA